MDSSTQDRNLPASEQRLRKAREDGQVPRSRDLIHLVVLGGGLLLLSLLAPWGYERLRAAMQAQFRFTRAALDHPQHLQRVLSDTTFEGLLFFLPLGGVLLLAIVLAAVATGSFAYSTKSLMPDLSKIGLLSGFGRLFSRQQFFEVLSWWLMPPCCSPWAACSCTRTCSNSARCCCVPSNRPWHSLGNG